MTGQAGHEQCQKAAEDCCNRVYHQGGAILRGSNGWRTEETVRYPEIAPAICRNNGGVLASALPLQLPFWHPSIPPAEIAAALKI